MKIPRLPRKLRQRPSARTTLVTTFLAVALAGTNLHGQEKPSGGGNIPAQEQAPGYIIVFKKKVNAQDAANELESQRGLKIGRVYKHAIKGVFVPTDLPPQALEALKKNPNVAYVEKNAVGRLAAQPVPTGIDRVNGEDAVAIDGSADLIDVDIAVIDTGIDPTHPDLNVNHSMSVGYYSTYEGKGKKRRLVVVESFDVSDWADWKGHGTHVAGIAAAMDNEIGTVGVAPGARVTAVRVLHENNASNTATYLAGMDYVAAHADTFEVANMSIGHPASAAINEGVGNMTAAGVVVVAAAGNESRDVDRWISPGSAPSAITVSALADTDGRPGGFGPESYSSDGTSRGKDDTLATFSNYGALIDVAAPGVEIFSTYLNGGYKIGSGTSMATPHVAGAVALYIALNGRDRDGNGVIDGEDVAQMEALVKTTGWQLGDYEYFAGDTDGYPEPLLNVPNLLGHEIDQLPNVAITSPSDGEPVSGTITLQADASDDYSVTQVEFFVDGNSLGIDSDALDGYSLSWDSSSVSDGPHEISAVATDDSLQTSISSVLVSVDNEDSPPVADAGSDLIVQNLDGSGIESVVLDGSGSSDDLEIARYDWYSGSSLLGTGVTLSVDVPVGSHTFRLEVYDSIGQSSQDSVVITVEEAPAVANQVSVSSIAINGYGGKNGNNHLEAFTSLRDNLGGAVVGAVVEADLYKDNTRIKSSSGTTDFSGGAQLFNEKGIGAGCYSVVITKITVSGLTFDGATPFNEFCK